MYRRLAAVIAAVLVMQGIAAPAVGFDRESFDGTTAAHCADDAVDCADPCPCCPGGSPPMPGCWSLCTACITPFVEVSPILTVCRGTACDFAAVPPIFRAYAPPNPPPIGC